MCDGGPQGSVVFPLHVYAYAGLFLAVAVHREHVVVLKAPAVLKPSAASDDCSGKLQAG